MGTEFQKAHEVKEIAETLIDSYHPHLIGSDIEYVFVNPTPKSKGKDVWGRARKITGLNAYLAQKEGFLGGEPSPFFVIEISKEIWDAIPAQSKIALIDHELSHCGYDDEKDAIATLSHDVEEFSGVVKRHGLWQSHLKQFVELANESKKFPLMQGAYDSMEITAFDDKGQAL
jgi:predicted metallopeptidase